MRQIVYIILFIAALLVVKAMFLDDYLAKRAAEANATEANVSVKAVVPPQPQVVPPKPAVQKIAPLGEGNKSVDMRMMPKYKEAPLEKAGDAIAERLEDKIKVENGK